MINDSPASSRSAWSRTSSTSAATSRRCASPRPEDLDRALPWARLSARPARDGRRARTEARARRARGDARFLPGPALPPEPVAANAPRSGLFTEGRIRNTPTRRLHLRRTAHSHRPARRQARACAARRPRRRGAEGGGSAQQDRPGRDRRRRARLRQPGGRGLAQRGALRRAALRTAAHDAGRHGEPPVRERPAGGGRRGARRHVRRRRSLHRRRRREHEPRPLRVQQVRLALQPW